MKISVRLNESFFALFIESFMNFTILTSFRLISLSSKKLKTHLFAKKSTYLDSFASFLLFFLTMLLQLFLEFHEWMDEINEWMDEWMNGRVNGWVNEWMDEWMNGRVIEWTSEWLSWWMNGRMNELTNEWIDECNEWMSGLSKNDG